MHVDGTSSFVLGALELGASGLAIGQELDADEIEKFQLATDEEKAYQAAARYVVVRPRSRQEVATYLRRKGVVDDSASQILEKLTRNGLLDDKQFATAWVASRQMSRPRSRRRLVGELQNKGVAKDDIDDVLGETDPEREMKALEMLARKKQKLTQYRQPQKLIGYLLRQGYEYDLVKKVLERLELG